LTHIRVRLEIARSRRDRAIFKLAIDSKLRACDLVKLRLDDICSGIKVRHRATIVQKKTGRPVQFEITEQSRSSVEAWLPVLRATGSRYLFPSRLHASSHISTRQYARLVHRWVESIGLLWHALDAAYEGCPDLSQDRQPPRSATPPEIATATSSAAMEVVLERISRKEDDGNAAFLTDAYATIAIAYHRAAGSISRTGVCRNWAPLPFTCSRWQPHM